VAFGLVCGTDCIIDLPITDVDAKSNRPKAAGKVLAVHEREEKKKKKKRLEACLEQSVGTFLRLLSQRMAGLLRKEAKKILEKLSALLADDWENPYSHQSVDVSMLE
jgi:signal transduction protein with GAF and PtsI domain